RIDPREAGNIEDVSAAAAAHEGDRLPCAIKRAGEICFDGRGPLLGSELVDRLEDPDAGIIHEDVKAAEALRGTGHDRPTVFVAANISRHPIDPFAPVP